MPENVPLVRLVRVVLAAVSHAASEKISDVEGQLAQLWENNNIIGRTAEAAEEHVKKCHKSLILLLLLIQNEKRLQLLNVES